MRNRLSNLAEVRSAASTLAMILTVSAVLLLLRWGGGTLWTNIDCLEDSAGDVFSLLQPRASYVNWVSKYQGLHRQWQRQEQQQRRHWRPQNEQQQQQRQRQQQHQQQQLGRQPSKLDEHQLLQLKLRWQIAMLPQAITRPENMTAANPARMQNRPKSVVPGPRENPPVPLLINAILGLIVQYFLVHTLLAIARTINRLTGTKAGGAEMVIESAATPVGFTPMLCTLFFAPYSQAIRLTGSVDPTALDRPSFWIQDVIAICSAILILKTTLHIFVGCVLLRPASSPLARRVATQENGDDNTGSAVGQAVLSFGCVVASLLYASIAGVVMGTVYAVPPHSESDALQGEPKALNTVTYCTLLLASQYFVMTLVKLILSVSVDFKYTAFRPIDSEILEGPMNAVRPAAMLCLLFQAGSLHAIELSPPHGEPPVQVCSIMLLAAYALFAHVLLQLSVAALDHMVHDKKNEYQLVSRCRCIILGVLRPALFTVVYVGAGYVCISVWSDPTLTDLAGGRVPDDAPQLDPPSASSTVLCVVLVATIYFGVQLIHGVGGMMQQSTQLKQIINASRDAVVLCPMVSVLFISVRYRSLQLSGGLGEPQAWLQGCVHGVVVGLVVRLVAGVAGAFQARSESTGVPEDGLNHSEVMIASETNACTAVAAVAWALQLASTLAVYTCTLAIVVGLFLMRQENTQEFQEDGVDQWSWQ